MHSLLRLQNEDGGWNWWDGPTSDPQTTAYVVLGLLEARDSGYTISQTVLDNGITVISGDGYFGWQERAPYDAIIVSAGFREAGFQPWR